MVFLPGCQRFLDPPGAKCPQGREAGRAYLYSSATGGGLGLANHWRHTGNTYSHVLPTLHRQAAEAMDALLSQN